MTHNRKSLRLAATASALLLFWTAPSALAACAGGPDVFTCLTEADYLAKVAALGYAPLREGFEDDADWGSVRSTLSVTNSAPSITSQGIVWTANHAQNEITTGAGARRTGLWGIYDPDHGYATGTTAQCDVDLPPEHCLWYDGFTGTRAAGQSPLYAAGGYIRTSTVGASVTLIIDDVRQYKLGKLADTAHHFFGVIDRRGFSRFQFREVDGKLGQKFLIFGDDFTFGLSPTAVWPAASPATVNQDWTFIDAASGFANAVVIAGPPSYHNPHPGVARLRNVTDLGFEMRFQEWDYRRLDFADTTHPKEDVPYVVLRPGRHLMTDGSVWEVGTFPIRGTNRWQSQLFTEPFAKVPHLFLTVQTANGASAISVRARNVTADGFEAALAEEEALNDGHPSETLGYLAVESPGGSGWIDTARGQAPYLLQGLNANQRWIPVLSQRIRLEEEKSLDAEVTHPDESLAVLALGNQFLAQQVTSTDPDTTALRRLEPTTDAPMEWGVVRGLDQDWRVLPFAKSYTNPVVVAKPSSDLGKDPGVIRLTGVSGDQAQLRYQEWDYLDGSHTPTEDCFYMVAEAGQHSLGGLPVEAGSLNTGKIARKGQWAKVSLASPFVQAPVLLSAVMTNNGAQAVTTRTKGLTTSAFSIAMDEQELFLDGHATETLGWIAIEPGLSITADGRRVEALVTQIDATRVTVPYTKVTHRHPTVLGDVDSAFELDPVSLRYASPTNQQIRLRLAEEQSLDAETDHLLEDVGLFVAE